MKNFAPSLLVASAAIVAFLFAPNRILFGLAAAIFLAVMFVRERKGRKNSSALFLTATYSSSFLVGAAFITGLSMLTLPFVSNELIVGHPLNYLPAITTSHIALGGMSLMLICFTTVIFMVRYEMRHHGSKSGDFSGNSSIWIERFEAASADQSQANQLTTGDQLGEYELTKFIGSGSFADVWQVSKDGRNLAAKIARKSNLINKHGSPEEEAARWVAVGEHPNIVKIREARKLGAFSKGVDKGTYFVIVMDLYSRGTLKDVLSQRTKLPSLEAVKLTLEILKGLSVIHSANLIHRDIKPSNILLDGHIPKIGDFGLSRFLDDTQSSQLAGTINYMSPEALEGRRGPDNDVWSVAVMLLELLSGVFPETRLNIQTTLKNLAVAEPLKRVLQKALDSNFDRRVKTANELANILEIALTTLEE